MENHLCTLGARNGVKRAVDAAALKCINVNKKAASRQARLLRGLSNVARRFALRVAWLEPIIDYHYF